MLIRLTLSALLIAAVAACSGAKVSNDKHPKVGAGVTADRIGGR